MRIFILSLFFLAKGAYAQEFNIFVGLRNMDRSNRKLQSLRQELAYSNEVLNYPINYIAGVSSYKKNKYRISLGLGYSSLKWDRNRRYVQYVPSDTTARLYEYTSTNQNQTYRLMLDYMRFERIGNLQLGYGAEIYASLNHKDYFEHHYNGSTDLSPQNFARYGNFSRTYPNIWTFQPALKGGAYYQLMGNLTLGVELMPNLRYEIVNTKNKKLTYNRREISNAIEFEIWGQLIMSYKIFSHEKK